MKLNRAEEQELEREREREREIGDFTVDRERWRVALNGKYARIGVRNGEVDLTALVVSIT